MLGLEVANAVSAIAWHDGTAADNWGIALDTPNTQHPTPNRSPAHHLRSCTTTHDHTNVRPHECTTTRMYDHTTAGTTHIIHSFIQPVNRIQARVNPICS